MRRIATLLAVLLCGLLPYLPALSQPEHRANDAVGDDPVHCASALLAEPGPSGPAMSGGRLVTIEDLATLRDFGPSNGLFDAPPIGALSPDGTTIALALRRADPAHNRYCQGIVLVDLQDRQPPRLVDHGGDYVRETVTMRGLQSFETGLVRDPMLSWSPDGAHLLYLRRDGGPIQLRIVPLSDGRPYTVPLLDADVIEAHWRDQPGAISLTTQAPDPDETVALAGEALTGFRYDDRFWPTASDRPFLRKAFVHRSYEVRITPAVTITEATRPPNSAVSSGDRTIEGAAGTSLTLSAATLRSGGAVRLRTAGSDALFRCGQPLCFRVIDAWYVAARSRFYLLASSGFAVSRYSLYEWNPSKPQPRRLFETDDLLLGCQPWTADLLCAVETATAPRKLVAIDLGSGGRMIKFDPNPAFGRLRLGPVERLHWVNNQGIETFGDLVLPSDHRPATALPLVVVQYNSRGFLRGGTGDEYPIHALAAAGFAVLSFSRPLDVSIILQRQGKVVPKDYVRTWRDRRSVHSSLVRGIAIVRKRITIRPDKIAITGLSDGASTAAFALANSHLFSTALLSTCCDDPRQWLSDLGSTYRAERLADGYPFPVQAHQHYWRKGILAMNARRGCVSLLLQLADSEFRTALPTYEAWKAAGVPVELSIYPNETHLKWQAAHRLALYAKAVDWLSRWRQKDRLRCSPSDRDE